MSLPDARIIVMDTGISVNDPQEFYPTWMSDPEEFQAYEVWRRLCGALAAGARAVGWDAWMGTDDLHTATDGRFEGYGKGLREDDLRNNRRAVEAVPRDSWIAFQRFAELFGAVTSGGFVHPTVPVDSDFTPGVADHLVILRFRLSVTSGSYTYAYVILVDPNASVDDGWAVQAEWSGSAGTLLSFDTEPVIRTTPRGGGELELPEVVAWFASGNEESMPWDFRMEPGDAIRVVQATKSVRWTVTYAP